MALRPFTDNELMEISKILGDTSAGFTGSEIGALLASCGFSDLEWARSRAHFLQWGFAPAISRLEEAAGRGFAGLHGAAQLSPS